VGGIGGTGRPFTGIYVWGKSAELSEVKAGADERLEFSGRKFPSEASSFLKGLVV